MSAERTYTVELRRRDPKGSWSAEAKGRGVALDRLIAKHPSPAWRQAEARINALRRGDHTRVELGADAAIVLERI